MSKLIVKTPIDHSYYYKAVKDMYSIAFHPLYILRQISFLLRVVGDFGYVKDELFFKELDSRPFNIRRRGDNNLLSRKITKFYQLKFYYEVIKSLFLLKDIKNVNFLKGLIAINVYLFNNFYIQSKIITMKIINKIYKSK